MGGFYSLISCERSVLENTMARGQPNHGHGGGVPETNLSQAMGGKITPTTPYQRLPLVSPTTGRGDHMPRQECLFVSLLHPSVRYTREDPELGDSGTRRGDRSVENPEFNKDREEPGNAWDLAAGWHSPVPWKQIKSHKRIQDFPLPRQSRQVKSTGSHPSIPPGQLTARPIGMPRQPTT